MLKFWNDYTSQELEELVKGRPLTKESVNYVLQNKIKEISVVDYVNKNAYAIPSCDGRYSIIIASNLSQEERSQSLIHEICHVNYRALGIYMGTPHFGPKREEARRIEEILEKEAQRWYRENKDFINLIINDL